MNKKSVIIIVIIDILILAIVYGVIKHYENEESDTTEGTGAVTQSAEEQADADLSGTANDTANNSSDQSNNQSDANTETDSDSQNADQDADDTSDSKPETLVIYSDGTQKNISKLTSSVFYRLKTVDAAGPSQWYELDVTNDAGSTWSVLNSDPFSGEGGAQNGIYFASELVGFIALNEPNGEEGQLYRTEDGGVTFTAVELPELTRELLTGSGEYYQPFDTPGVPYEEDGVLKLLAGQGNDGDYNGGSSAMFQSEDLGQTWSYVKEVIAVEYNG